MTEAFGNILPSWTWFIIGLMHICRLLTNKWSKHRLIRASFAEGDAVAFQDDIMNSHARVKKARWGQVMHAALQLLPLANVLNRFWSKVSYLRGGPVAAQRPGAGGDHEGTCNVDICDERIRSS